MSIGRLTSTFTPPDDCLSSYGLAFSSTSSHLFQGPGGATLSCFPPDYTNARLAYYSPGICPEGFTTAWLTTSGTGADQTTIVTCCPSHFQVNGATNYQWETTMQCSSPIDRPLVTDVIVVEGNDRRRTQETTLTHGAFNAFGIQIRFQSTDFQTTTASTDTETGALSNAVASATSSSPTQTLTTDSAVPKSGGGLSGGALAGIIIGCLIGGFAIAGGCILAFFYGRRRGRGINKEAASTQQVQMWESPKSPAELANRVASPQPVEIGSGFHVQRNGDEGMT